MSSEPDNGDAEERRISPESSEFERTENDMEEGSSVMRRRDDVFDESLYFQDIDVEARPEEEEEYGPGGDDEDFFAEFEFSPPRSIRDRIKMPPKWKKKSFERPCGKVKRDAGEEGEGDGQDTEGGSKVLEPTHPLLENFQKSLKAHLLKQIDKMKEDVLELETGCKKIKADHEQIGVEAYELQQLVNAQQQTIDDYVNKLQTTSAAKEEVELELEESLRNHKIKTACLMEAEKKEIELRTEMESLGSLLHNMTKWNEDIESELVINQRVAEKTRKDKLRLADEKKQQDMIMHKLSKEIWRLEGELETLVMKLRVKEEEREKLAEATSLSNIDIEANEADHRCLIHGWQSVICSITNRDKYYNNLLNNYKKFEEKMSGIQVEIMQVKKLTNKELVKNEAMTIFKERVMKDAKSTNFALENELQKRFEIEREIGQYEAVVEQLDKDFLRIEGENNRLMVEYSHSFRYIERLCQQKANIEEQIYAQLQERTTQDMASSNLKRLAREAMEKHRTLKIILARSIHNVRDMQKEAEVWETDLTQVDTQLTALQKQLDKEDKQLQEKLSEIAKVQRTRELNMRVFANFREKLDKLSQQLVSVDINPLEMKIRALEANINETIKKHTELQEFWIREQAIVVDMSEKRQEQIKEISLLKKQISILDQKNLKINDELEYYKNQETIMARNINSLQNKLALCTETLNKRKGSKDDLDFDNYCMQKDLILKLEGAEMEELDIKSDIAEIEEEKSTLSIDLIEINREGLIWDKKIKLAVEARKNMQQELGEEGEVGMMKAEIHRMHVRYSHLKKAQDKLMTDLEHCITRREAIVSVAEARLKFVKDGPQKVRINFQKKLDDARNKVKQLETEATTVEEKLKTQDDENVRVRKEILRICKEANDMLQDCETINNRILDQKTQKQLNLDLLLIKQRKLKVYLELARGRHPYTCYKTASAANSAYQKEKHINSNLTSIVENLLVVLPTHGFFLGKIYNTLQLPRLHL